MLNQGDFRNLSYVYLFLEVIQETVTSYIIKLIKVNWLIDSSYKSITELYNFDNCTWLLFIPEYNDISM